MLTRLLPFRLVAVLLAAFLVVAGLQTAASAATARALTTSVFPSVGAKGTAMIFSGKLTKSPKGSAVQVQRKSGAKWVKAASTKTVNTAGEYSVRFNRPTKFGSYSYRAYAPATRKLKAKASKTVTVAALNRAFISLTATPTTLTAGGSTKLAGAAYPFIKNTPITLQRRSGTTWVNVPGTAKLGASGTFSKTVELSTSTTFRAALPRAGSSAPAFSTSREVLVKPKVSTTSLPNGTRFGAYSTTLKTSANATGTWTAAPLPAGLTLNKNTGVISGTPSTVGDTQVTIGFTQQGGLKAANVTLTLRINQAVAPVISTTTLNNGTVGTAYTTPALTAQGNPAGTWTADLPDGLDVNPATGAITGTPETPGDFQVAVGFTQTNTNLAATPKTLNLHISQVSAPVISKPSLLVGSVGVAYSDTLTVTTTGDPAGSWTSTTLPGGLQLDPATGAITGTPTTQGDTQVTFNFTQGSTGLAAAPKTLLLQVDPGANPVITTTSLTAATRLTAYTEQVSVAGNPAGTWTATTLPAGLDFNTTTGAITGTPTTVGNTDVTFGFTQTSTNLVATPKTLTIHVNQAAAPVISTIGLTEGTRFSPYTATLTATGNPAGTWTAAPLPAGLDLNPLTGVISGSPTTPGDTNVVVGFTQSSTGVAATPKTLVLHINQAPAPVIGTANLPEGSRLAAYTTTLVTTPNVAGTWTATPLPAGLELNPATGVISGTPTAEGDTSVVIGFTQTSTGLTAAPKTLVLHINPVAPPVIETLALPIANRFRLYSTTLTAAGNPVGVWSAAPLPAGLSLNTATGVISGTPTAAGDTSVTIGFTQTNTGQPATPKVIVLHVDPPIAPTITTASLPDGIALSGSYSVQLAAFGNPVGTWSFSGQPVGVTINANTGKIGGNALFPGDYSVKITFKQTNSALSTTKTLPLHIGTL